MALGRGLGELLGEIETAYENSNEISEHEVINIDVNNIKLNPHQPRKVFDEEKLKELSDSIVENGLLQPVVVTRDGDNFLLIAGERRLRATKLAQIDTIKAIVLNVDDSKLRELALIENIQRDDLNIIEIAYSYAGLLSDHNLTHEELSKIVSKSRSSITNTLRLLTLSNFTQKMLGAQKITLGHAKVIIGLSQEQQKIVVDSIIGQKLNVRDTEILVKKLKNTENEDKNTKKVLKKELDFNILSDITNKLNKENLKVKIDNKYFKIEINTQEDIEKIVTYFKNR
ncbi:MAG: ParB/RepB/Spo0J family partition protein [Campylobacterota bacterium]|nr:ParB/RepB/Spo0J family partition protein [Campylobacterota bacterium]